MTAPAISIESKQRSLLANFSIVALGLMCLVPFLSPHHFPPIATFYNEWIAALLGLTASIFLLRRPAEFVFPVIAFLPIALILVLGMQIMLDKVLYWQNHYLIMLYLGLAALMMVLGANLREHVSLNRIVPALAWAIIAGGCISIAIIVVAQFGLSEVEPWSYFIRDYSASHIGQINHLANYLALGLASVLYLYLSSQLKFNWSVVLTTLFVLGLAYTGQRMALLYIFALSVIGWGLARCCVHPEFRSRAKHLLWLIPLFIAADLVMPLLSFLEAANSPIDRLAATMNGESVRLTYLEQAWQLFTQYPLIGVGWSGYAWHNFNVTDEFPNQTGMTGNAHNIVFQLMAETGAIGAGLLLLSVGWWLYHQRKDFLTPERWWVLSLLAVLGIHSLLEYPLWYAYFMVIAALVLGLGEQALLRKRLQLTPVLFTALLVFGAYSMGNLLQIYHKLEQTLMAFKMKEVEEHEINGILNELSNMRKASPLTPFVDNVIIRILPNHPDLLADKLLISNDVVRFWPGKSETYTHAYLMVMNNHKKEGQEMMRTAIKQFPYYPQLYLSFLTAEILKGNDRVLPLVFMLQEASEESR